MRKVKNSFSAFWELLKGKKTYLFGVCAIVYGLYAKDEKAIFTGLGLLGLRHGITTEVSRLLEK